MKLYNGTFQLNQQTLSMPTVGETTHEAAENLKKLVYAFTAQAPKNIEINAIIHGVDGPGESLNKLHKPVRKKKTAKS